MATRRNSRDLVSDILKRKKPTGKYAGGSGSMVDIGGEQFYSPGVLSAGEVATRFKGRGVNPGRRDFRGGVNGVTNFVKPNPMAGLKGSGGALDSFSGGDIQSQAREATKNLDAGSLRKLVGGVALNASEAEAKRYARMFLPIHDAAAGAETVAGAATAISRIIPTDTSSVQFAASRGLTRRDIETTLPNVQSAAIREQAKQQGVLNKTQIMLAKHGQKIKGEMASRAKQRRDSIQEGELDKTFELLVRHDSNTRQAAFVKKQQQKMQRFRKESGKISSAKAQGGRGMSPADPALLQWGQRVEQVAELIGPLEQQLRRAHFGGPSKVVDAALLKASSGLAQWAEEGFNPEGKGYDYYQAIDAGQLPDDTGHWSSLDGRTGRVLKGINHPTFNLTLEVEHALGNSIEKRDDGFYYSVFDPDRAMSMGLDI